MRNFEIPTGSVVRIRAPSPFLELERGTTWRVKGPSDKLGGYYVISLEEPIPIGQPGAVTQEILEAADNLEIIELGGRAGR